MKSFTYHGSGWSETVMNIGDEWSLMDSVLSIAIDAYKKEFKSLCEKTYKTHEFSTLGKYYVADSKRAIRKLQKMQQALTDGERDAYKDYDKFHNAIIGKKED